jgi:hypothetical protein
LLAVRVYRKSLVSFQSEEVPFFTASSHITKEAASRSP